MYVHTLQFTTRAELSWAFQHLLSSPYVEDCLSEPDALRLRFVAPPRSAAVLIDRIYLRGALTWCLRSRLPRSAPTPA
ncbi:MAG: hypothetical protein ACE5FG_13150 [Myxococcota bacterium]